jgi:hypothetical protein
MAEKMVRPDFIPLYPDEKAATERLRATLPAGSKVTKVERVDSPPYLSDELVEQIAVLHNGGTWPEDYKESHRQHWRGQAVKIIELVRKYLDNPTYVVTTPESDPEILRAIFQLAERGIEVKDSI